MIDDEEDVLEYYEEEGDEEDEDPIEGPALVAEADACQAINGDRLTSYSKNTRVAYRQALESFLTNDRGLQFESLKFLFKAVHCDFTGKTLAQPKVNPIEDVRHMTVYMCGPSRPSCKCECLSGGPCGHKWDGPEERTEYSSSATCSKCDMSAMSHALWVAP